MVEKLDGAGLIESLATIPEPYWAALSLFYMQDYSYKQIADILGIPLGTVRSRISRGIRLLQNSMSAGMRAASLKAMLHSEDMQ